MDPNWQSLIYINEPGRVVQFPSFRTTQASFIAYICILWSWFIPMANTSSIINQSTSHHLSFLINNLPMVRDYKAYMHSQSEIPCWKLNCLLLGRYSYSRFQDENTKDHPGGWPRQQIMMFFVHEIKHQVYHQISYQSINQSINQSFIVDIHIVVIKIPNKPNNIVNHVHISNIN